MAFRNSCMPPARPRKRNSNQISLRENRSLAKSIDKIGSPETFHLSWGRLSILDLLYEHGSNRFPYHRNAVDLCGPIRELILICATLGLKRRSFRIVDGRDERPG